MFFTHIYILFQGLHVFKQQLLLFIPFFYINKTIIKDSTNDKIPNYLPFLLVSIASSTKAFVRNATASTSSISDKTYLYIKPPV